MGGMSSVTTTDTPESGQATPARPGEWTATLQYQEIPLWDTMQSHTNILIRRMKDEWLGLQDGDVKRDEELVCVTLDFELPSEHQAPADHLLEFIEKEWRALAGPDSSVAVEPRENV